MKTIQDKPTRIIKNAKQMIVLIPTKSILMEHAKNVEITRGHRETEDNAHQINVTARDKR